MPIRTYTVEQAAKIFVDHYNCHMSPSSPARLIDPRQCDACIKAWEDLRFALDRQEHRAMRSNITVLNDNKIVELFR